MIEPDNITGMGAKGHWTGRVY